MISIDDLKTAIEASWDASTSFCADEWTRANPTRGQCVVTSLLVQAYFGGELRKYDTGLPATARPGGDSPRRVGRLLFAHGARWRLLFRSSVLHP